MSSEAASVPPDQLKDEKKKRKKSVKSSEAKSKSSSRKSSNVVNDNGEPLAAENGEKESAEISQPLTNGTSEPNESHEKIVNGTTSDSADDVKTDEKLVVPEGAGPQEKNVIMLGEKDFRKLAELKEAFYLFDINQDGFIDKEDLKFTFTSMGRQDVSDETLDKMLSEMSSEAVDFDAFVKLFGYKAVELDPEEELLDALSKWDYLGNGMISEERLKRDLQGWGDKFSDIETERALEEAPVYKKDGNTMIDYVKFCNNICGLRNVEKTRQIEKEAADYEDDLKRRSSRR
ncbi:myosin regulatory light chain [Athalia rosae]|uniref:myosin regulatory light chain n=1 Tax=Athalia rosae TaxID=37344 RepID=UPI0020342A53|nr:myosin regulatory light chain [Athalia rosae]